MIDLLDRFIVVPAGGICDFQPHGNGGGNDVAQENVGFIPGEEQQAVPWIPSVLPYELRRGSGAAHCPQLTVWTSNARPLMNAVAIG